MTATIMSFSRFWKMCDASSSFKLQYSFNFKLVTPVLVEPRRSGNIRLKMDSEGLDHHDALAVDESHIEKLINSESFLLALKVSEVASGLQEPEERTMEIYIFIQGIRGYVRVRKKHSRKAAKIDGFAKRSENPKHFESEKGNKGKVIGFIMTNWPPSDLCTSNNRNREPWKKCRRQILI